MFEERKRKHADMIDDTEDVIEDYHDMGWGSSDYYITEEEAKEFLNGKLLAINDGEYTHTVKVIKEE